MLKQAKIFNQEISIVTANELSGAVSSGRKMRIAKVNTEFLQRALVEQRFSSVLNGFDLKIADGRGVLWAAKYLTLPVVQNRFLRSIQATWQMLYSGLAIIFYPKYIQSPIPENIPGVEALRLMLGAAEKTGQGVFFFGAEQNDLDRAIKNIQREMPDLLVSGTLNGYDFQRDSSIDPVEIINKTNAKLLIVALGSPLQEYWIQENMSKLKNIRVAVGEGGSLAFLAGTMKRAPKWINRIGLEWLWRLFLNRSLTHQTGSRLKRVWNAVPVFIFEAVRWKIKNGANK